MDDRLLLKNGGPPFTELLRVGEIVVVRRPGARVLDRLFLLLSLVLGIPVIAGMLVAIGVMLWVFVTEGKGLALLVAIVFGIALLPGSGAFLWIQGLLFPFKVTLENSEYRLAKSVRKNKCYNLASGWMNCIVPLAMEPIGSQMHCL